MSDTPRVISSEAGSGLSTEDAVSVLDSSIGLSTETGQKRAIDQSDRLTIINQALINTGNNPVNVGDDTSDEWKVASSAFDQWSRTLLYRRNWNFAKREGVKLLRIGDSTYPGYADIFAKPADCLFLENVYRSDLAALAYPSPIYGVGETRTPPLDYKIFEDRIHCTAPQGVMAIYTPFPVGSQPWSTGFVDALRLKIESTIYRGLNEDASLSGAADREAEAILGEAVARSNSEEPRRVGFRSTALEARRRRHTGWWP